MNDKDSFFSYLKNLFTKSEQVTSVNTTPEMYMILRYLSMHPEGFFVASEVNKFNSKLPSWAMGCLLYNLLPKKPKAPYMDYIKRKEIKDNELITKLGEVFCCRPTQAQDIYNLLLRQKVNIETAFGLQEGESIGYKNKSKPTKTETSIPNRITKWRTT